MNTTKIRYFWYLCLFLCLCVPALGAQVGVNVLFDLKDARLQSAPNYTNRTVWVQAMSIPNLSSPSVVLGAPIVSVTDTNGEFWLTNLVPNLYYVTVKAPPRQEAFKFLIITNYPGTINAADNLVADSTATFPAGSVAWAAAVTDFRYGGTVPRPAPADGWMLTMSNTVAVWTQNGGALTNLGVNQQFVFSNGGPGTNNDFKWNLASPSQWIRFYKADNHTVSLEYQSGAIQQLMHTHDNTLHFNFPPFYDYSTASTVAWFDGLNRLESIPTGTGALTNDGLGDLGWDPTLAVNTNYIVTPGGGGTNNFLKDVTTYHVDQLGAPWSFNGQEFWDTNFSSVIPVGRFLGGAVPSFTVNGQLFAEKTSGSTAPPLVVDVGTPGAADMILGRSNGLPRFHVTFDGGVQANGMIISTNGFQSLSATLDSIAYWDPNKKLVNVPNAVGTLTNDGFGVVGWLNTANLWVSTLNGRSTNQALLNPTLTNAVNYGNAFSSPSAGFAQSEQFGANASAAAIQGTSVGNQATASATAATALGASSLASAAGATALGESATASGVHSTAIGFSATTTQDHQIQMGTSAEYVNVPGALSAGSITNGAATISTVAAYDSKKKLVSVPNGTGFLENNGSGALSWGTSPNGFDAISSGENTTAIMRVGTGAILYPTNLGKIFANYATNVPLSGKVGGLNVTGTANDTQLQQAQTYPTLDWNAAMDSGIGTLFGTGDFSISGTETNRGYSTWGVLTNDTNGKKYSAAYLVPQLMGTNTLLVAGTNIAFIKTFLNGVTTYTIEGLTASLLALNNIFTGSNHFSGGVAVDGLATFNNDVTINDSLHVTGGITNDSLTAKTVIETDANKRLQSVPTGSGALTNDATGNIGWYAGYATTAYVDAATNQLAIATTNRINTLGANATNNDLKIGQNLTNYANIVQTAAKNYTDTAINVATNVLDTQVDVNAKVTGAATNHVYVKTTDQRVNLSTNTASGPTLYTVNLSPGITNFDQSLQVTNTSVAGSFAQLSRSNLVIKGANPAVALGTDTNALVSLNNVDFMFQAEGTNSLSITNTGNGIALHSYWPFDLSFGNSFYGLIGVGNVTNSSGSRVAYYNEVGNLALSTNCSESISAAQAANYAALSTDEIILMNGNLSVTLPTAVGIKGHSYTIKTVTTGTNAIIPFGGQTIDGYARYTNVAQWKFTRITGDGANWFVTGQN